MQSGQHVTVEHRTPPGRGTVGDAVHTDSSAGVIHQRIHGVTLQDTGGHLLHLRLIAQISRPVLATDLGGKSLQALAARATATILHPRFANRRAVACPIPLEPPVTTTRREMLMSTQ